MIIKEGEHKRRDRDFYPTPPEFCDQAFRQCQTWLVHQQHPIRVLDAGAGTGNWGRALKAIHPAAYIVGVDLPEVDPVAEYDEWHRDFFEVWCMNYTDEPFDLVIGNPPYGNKTPEKWLKMLWNPRLLTPDARVFWLLRLGWFSSQGRFNRLWTQGYMPASIYQSARRISFTDDGNTDDTDYAMYLWMRDSDCPNFAFLSAFDWQPESESDQMELFAEVAL